jgi:hypothetical protein
MGIRYCSCPIHWAFCKPDESDNYTLGSDRGCTPVRDKGGGVTPTLTCRVRGKSIGELNLK